MCACRDGETFGKKAKSSEPACTGKGSLQGNMRSCLLVFTNASNLAKKGNWVKAYVWPEPHIFGVCVCVCFCQGKRRMYGHIRCIYV